MSLFFRGQQQRGTATLSATLRALGVPDRESGYPVVNPDSSLRHSAVWACLRLRADLVSTTPLDVFRRVAGVQVEMPKPPVLVTPDGSGIEEWLWATQFDLDRYGNCFGIITQRDGLGLPSRIELVPAGGVTVRTKDGVITEYWIDGKRYDPRDVWHERQYRAPGMAVGLSPIAYAAWSIGSYLSAQEFALAWFSSDAAPAGHLRNTLKPTIERTEAAEVKERWKQAISGRDVFVTGRDWEYTMHAVPANSVMFLDEMKYGVGDVCRFLAVPGDLIDAESSTGSVTYANVTQRNLQLLVMNLGPVYVRRERALSGLTTGPRFVKFNTDALLRMDPEARSAKLVAEVAGRLITPTEARELDNRGPFTDADYAEFDRLFGNPNRQPDKQGAPA